MFGEKRFLADPLRCCGLLFDTFDRLSKPVYIRQTVDYHPFFGNNLCHAMNARPFPFSFISNLTFATRTVRDPLTARGQTAAT